MKKKLLLILSIPIIIALGFLFFLNNQNNKASQNRNSIELLTNGEANNMIDQLNIDEKNAEIESVLDKCLQLGNYYYYKQDYEESLFYFIKTQRLAKPNGQPGFIADINYKIALNHLGLGEYIKAYRFAIKTDSIEKSNKIKSAETLNLLGSIYEKTGLYVNALSTHYQSLELQKNKNNKLGMANSYHNLAHIYLEGKRYDKAHLYYKNALETYQQLSVDALDSVEKEINIAKIKLSLGNYFILQNDSVNALKNLEEALKVFTKYDRKENIAQTLGIIGNLYFSHNNYEKASRYYKQSLKISKTQSFKTGIISENLNLGKIYYFKDSLSLSIACFKTSLWVAQQIGSKRQIAEAADLLYSIYKQYADSVEQTKKYATVLFRNRKHLPNDDMQDSLIQMSVKHEVTLEKNEEIALEKYKRKVRTGFLSAILVVVIAIALFVYFKNKETQRKEYEKKLAKEQALRFKEVVEAIEGERKRIAIDLHDSLGQMLSTTKLYLSGLEEMVEDKADDDKELYSNTITLLDESCGELRNISFNIMPSSFIKYGLIVAIEELVGKINDSKQISAVFKNKGISDKLLSENAEIIVYRIVQETLNNIIKHAKASKATVVFSRINNYIGLSIRDDGIGMDNFEQYKYKGLGWKSIFTRVLILDGIIDVSTSLGKGTSIEILIPVKE